MNNDIRRLLEAVSEGKTTVDEALLILKKEPYVDLGYAKVDLHRKTRQGATEVIYGAGKTAEQISGIIESLIANGQSSILITRLSEEKAQKLGDISDFKFYKEASLGFVGCFPKPDGIGNIVVAAAGTSDLAVAEEAAITAEALGNRVVRLYDIGVSGLHRLLSHLDEVMSASVIISVAGMEGALTSVLGGLSDCPIISVPTSVGYGASFDGLAALLSMLNSCSSGVSVVNIDNGFGAGYQASMINHMEAKNESTLF